MQSTVTRTAVTRFGRFSYFRNEEFIGAALNDGRHWEEKLIDFILPLLEAQSVVIDGGAHIGSFTIPCASRCKRVYALEMQAPIYNLLLHNLSANGISNVIPMCMALGPHCGEGFIAAEVPDGHSRGLKLEYEASRPVNYGGIPLGVGGASVEMTTIDSLHLHPNLIKLDLEGWEPLAVKGGLDTILRCKPVILFERNWKQIAPEVAAAYHLSTEEANFPFPQYLKERGYEAPYPVVQGSDFLLFPRFDIEYLINSKVTDMLGTVNIISLDPEKGYTVKIGERGPYPLYAYAPERLLLIVTDMGFEGTPFKGVIEQRREIKWSNNTSWLIQ